MATLEKGLQRDRLTIDENGDDAEAGTQEKEEKLRLLRKFCRIPASQSVCAFSFGYVSTGHHSDIKRWMIIV